jgi:hypothetical protein
LPRKKKRMLRSEQAGQQAKRLGGNKFATNLMPGEASAFEQQHPRAIAGTGDSRRSSRWPAANDDQIEHR